MKKMGLKGLMAIALTLLIFGFATNAKAETALGKFCWEVQEPGESSWIASFNVYAKEGGHYELSGSDTNLSVYHGNAVTVGNIVRLNLSLSGTDNTGEAWAGNIIGSLNPSTLNGTWIFLGLGSDIGFPPTPERTTGSMTRIQCP